MPDSLTLTTSDSLTLEAEVAVPDDPRAAMLLCHPHPQYGGNMRSIVTGALFEALPRHGVACLRFNFRGVEGSEGQFADGDDERLDADAGLAELVERVPDVLTVVQGWSFGADIASAIVDERHHGWFLVALPLSFGEPGAAGADPRPKLVALAEHDQFRTPDEVAGRLDDWKATRVEIVGGADHFFVGRTDRLVDLALGQIDEMSP